MVFYIDACYLHFFFTFYNLVTTLFDMFRKTGFTSTPLFHTLSAFKGAVDWIDSLGLEQRGSICVNFDVLERMRRIALSWVRWDAFDWVVLDCIERVG